MTYEQRKFSANARRGAALVAVVATLTLAARLWLRTEQSGGLLAALSFLTQFFTILTNAMTLGLMLWIALGLGVPPRLTRALVIAIVCVGLIYHALLAHLVSLSGMALWADHGTHTFVPLFAGLWWIFLAPKQKLRASDALLWVAWPLTYCIYILIRAAFSGFYPYPFLDLPQIGWVRLIANTAGLLLGFVVVGLALAAVERWMPRVADRAKFGEG